MPVNWNCDGGTAHSTNPEVRVYPLGAGGNLILCRLCWDHENKYRAGRGGERAGWPQVAWTTAEVYSNQERENVD